MMEIKVDFNNLITNPMETFLKEVSKGELVFPDNRKKTFNKHSSKILEIEDLDIKSWIPSNVIIKAPEKFIQVKFEADGELFGKSGEDFLPISSTDLHHQIPDLKIVKKGRYNDIVDFKLKYWIYIDINKIDDYQNPLSDIETISISIDKRQDNHKNSQLFKKTKTTNTLVFIREKPKVQLNLDLNYEFKQGKFHYQDKKKVKLGELTINRISSRNYCEDLELDVDLRLVNKKGNDFNNCISFGSKTLSRENLSGNFSKTTALFKISQDSLKPFLKEDVFLDLTCLPPNTNYVANYILSTKSKGKKGSEIINLDIQEVSVNFKISPIIIHEKILTSFQKEPLFNEPVHYGLKNKTEVGKLIIEIPKDTSINFPLNFTISLKEPEIDEFSNGFKWLYFENALVDGSSNNEAIDSIQKLSSQSIKFKNFPNGGELGIPVYFDMENMNINTDHEISISSKITIESAGVIKEASSTISFLIEPVKIENEFKIQLTPHDSFDIPYNHKTTDEPVIWADLHVERCSTFYNKPLDFSVSIDIEELQRGDLFDVALDNISTSKGCDISKNPSKENEFLINNCQPGEFVKFPVKLKLNLFPKNSLGLTEASDYTGVSSISWEGESLSSNQFPFKLQSARIPSELFLACRESSTKTFPKTEDSYQTIVIEEPTKWKKARSSSSVVKDKLCFTLGFGNKAKVGDGAVYIKNLVAKFGEFIDSEPRNRLSEQSKLEVKDPSNNYDFFCYQNMADFDTKTKPIKELKNEMISLSDQLKGNASYFKFYFPENAIQNIKDHTVHMIGFITFDYLESNRRYHEFELENIFEKKSEEVKNYTIEIRFIIEKDEGSHWLALDLGTSAIVTAFDSKFTDNPKIINLQEELENNIGADNYEKSQIFEFDTSFLSSAIKLRYLGHINPKMNLPEKSPYDNDLVFLSPKLSDIKNEPQYVIPYLKSLIGAEYINQFNDELEALRYYNEEGKLTLNDDESNYILRKNESESFESFEKITIANILENTYRSLFRDFIVKSKEIKINPDAFNKMIISIPNTFTPKHVDLIRDVILEKLKDNNFTFRKENLLFISESDAVATYYINYKKSDLEVQEGKDVETEYLLVYDIGAGTLDLTYLKIDRSKEGQKVEILGRIGKNSAGNHFDFVLGKAIYDLYGDKNDLFIEGLDLFKYPKEVEHRNIQINYKNFVRNWVKPSLGKIDLNAHRSNSSSKEDAENISNFEGLGEFSLNDPDFDLLKSSIPLNKDPKNISPKDGGSILERIGGGDDFIENGASLKIDLIDLINHVDVQYWLNENTTQLFNNFFSFFSNKFSKKDEKIPLDTVLLSGRSGQMMCLKHSINTALEEITTPGFQVFDAREIFQRELRKGNDLILKSVVVKGAMQYVTNVIKRDSSIEIINENLKAEYGFLCKDTRPREKPWKYFPMLTIKTKPYNSKKNVLHGLTIRPYLVEIPLDLTNRGEIVFVQTHSANTESDYNSDRQEFISEIFRTNLDEIGAQHNPKEVLAMVRIDLQDHMRVEIGDFAMTYDEPIKIDLFENQYFIKSMWPYYYEK